MTTLRRPAGAAVLALALLGAPSLAQDRGGDAQAPAAQPQRPDPQQQPRAAEGQRDPQQQPAERPEPGRGAQPGNQPGQQPGAVPRGPGAGGDAPIKKLVEEEARHRATLAKLERLRELALQKGQNERLSALAEMLKKENERHKAMLDKARQIMGDDAYRAVEEKLASGRHRGQQGGRKPQPGQEPNRKPDAPRPENPQGQQPPGERAKNPPQGEAPQGNRPKGDAPKGDAPKGDNRQPGAPQGGQRNDSPRG
jgi:hypothetical protein